MFNKKQMKELLKEVEKEKNNLEIKVSTYNLERSCLHTTIDELREEVELYKQKYAEEIEKRVSLAEKLSKYV